MKLKFIIIFWASFFWVATYAQEIAGVVISSNNQPLGYVNVFWKKNLKGTLTSLSGNFNISKSVIPDDTLVFELLGYNKSVLTFSQIDSFNIIKLQPKAFELKEVVVKPQPPTYYIKQAVKATNKNFDTSAYYQKSYYREQVKENNWTNKYSEAILIAQFPKINAPKSDSLLIAFLHVRKSSKVNPIQFMKKTIDKQVQKEIKSYEKKNEEVPESLQEFDGVPISLGGPHYMFGNNFIINPSEFLDSNNFKYYNYYFNGITQYKGTPALEIKFEPRKKSDKSLFEGTVLINEEYNAFTMVEFQLSEDGKKEIIPTVLKPILWAMGLTIEVQNLALQVFASPINEKWYVDYMHFEAQIMAEKSHWFQDDEQSVFKLDQLMMMLEKPNKVDHQIFKTNRVKKSDIYNQIENKPDIFWDTFKLEK